jgi:hypothetical protein
MQLLRGPHRWASGPGTNHGMGVVIGETAVRRRCEISALAAFRAVSEQSGPRLAARYEVESEPWQRDFPSSRADEKECGRGDNEEWEPPCHRTATGIRGCHPANVAAAPESKPTGFLSIATGRSVSDA